MGLCLSKANTYSSSADRLDQWLSEKIEEGVRYYRHGKYQEALACLDQAIAEYPNSEETHLRKWYVFIEQDNTEEAKKEREIVSKINPENLVVSCSLANAEYRKTGDKKAYEKAMDKILKVKAKNFHEYVLQGGIYADRGNIEMEIAKYREALEFKPDAGIYHDLGIVLNHRGDHHAAKDNPQASKEDYQASKEAFLASIELDREWGSSWSGLGTVYYDLGEYEAALEAHSKAVDLTPNDLLKLCNRADDYIALNRREEANKDFALAQKLLQNPENLKGLSAEQIEWMKSLLELATIDLTTIKQEIDGATESEALEFKQKAEDIERHRDELVSQAVSVVGSKNQDQDMMATIFEQMQKMQQEIANLRSQLAAKADVSAVSAAIRVNSAEEGIYQDTQKIKADKYLLGYNAALKFTINAAYSSGLSVMDGALAVDTSNIGVATASMLASMIPFAGGVVSKTIQTVGNLITSSTVKQKAAIFTKIASGTVECDNLILHLSLKVTLHPDKVQQLHDRNIAVKAKGWWSGFCTNLVSVGEAATKQLEGDHYSTPEAKLGHQDAMKVITGITERISNGFIATPLVSEDSFIDQCLEILGLTSIPEIHCT